MRGDRRKLANEEIIIGGYRRVGVLQTGQNSEVWEVAEVGGKQRFAMKLLLPDQGRNKLQRAALRTEALVGLKLEHPNIIRFYKFVNDRNNPFIIMEYFRSSNLKLQIMRGESVNLRPRLRRVLRQFCQALGHLHSKGWVHRDIKPDNLLVNSSAEVRLIDFAIAVRSATGFAKFFVRKVKPAGTRSYMSPEQILGVPLDGRADIYSFGVMLYEFLSGRLPFTGNSGRELLQKHLRADAPLLGKETGTDPALAEYVRRMMAKDPKDRPASIDEVERDLRTIRFYLDDEIEGEAGV